MGAASTGAALDLEKALHMHLTEADYRAALEAFDWASRWDTTTPGWGQRVDELSRLAQLSYRIDSTREIWNQVVPPEYRKRHISVGLITTPPARSERS